MRRFNLVFLALMLSAGSTSVWAQGAVPAEEDAADEAGKSLIIVTAPRIQGSVDTDFPPDLVLDEAAVESYGASSITDLLAALSTQTQTTRARGVGGAPVVLLNGRRVSGFAEIRDIPPEAIRRVEVLPEDAAIRFGFSPGQRVVNFILKQDFAAFSGEVEHGGAMSGGRGESELQATWLKITKSSRINLSAEYDRDTAISERERKLIPAGSDQSGLRTLLPKSDALELNSIFSRGLSAKVNATVNLRYDLRNTEAVLGLPQALITTPTATPFTVLERAGRNRDFRAGTTVDGIIGRWRWTVTGNYDLERSTTLTDRNVTVAAQLGAIPVDTARSRSSIFGTVATADGPILTFPAGRVVMSLKVGYEDRSFRSTATSAIGTTTGAVNRSDLNGRAAIEVPVLRRSEGLGRALGEFSVNANYARSDLSDFGELQGHGYGFVWSPLEGVSLFGSVTVAQAAPTPQQLGNPLIVTPNVTVYDYLRNETVTATLISGGNPLLRAEEQRDRSITLSITPQSLKQLALSATYTRKRSDDLLTNFPSLTLDTERAFPGRITRDAGGRLVSIDQRPINFLAARDDSVRWGFNFFKEFAKPPAGQGGLGGMIPGGGPRGPGGPGGPGMGGPRPGGPPGGGAGGGGGRGPGGPGGPGMFGGQGSGRWSISLFHTMRLNDDIAIATGLPLLDRLNGGATGLNGGTPKHSVDLDGGWFNKGFGFRANANWKSGTRVDGATAAQDLFFSDLTTFNIRFFLNFDQRKEWVKDVPFLKGARLSFRVGNIFDDIIKVRDRAGVTPLRYQPGYVDPIGRNWEISFRKLF